MSLHSSTLPTQPPPLNPRSEYDVASFDILTKSLRQHPDMSPETDKSLNSFQLAKFVDGVRRFQDAHLGLKNKYRPTLRLPAPLLYDRSTSGPLYHAIVSAFKVKQSSPWRHFNLDNPKLYDDNIALLKRMEGDLINAGLLKRPRVYFDKSVEQLGQDEVKRLVEIATNYGASIATEEEVESGKVTHIVTYDPEEHDAPSILEEEAGEQLDREKKFVRTLGVFDIPIEGEGENLVMKRMALVHWWYFPSSYDEWMDASDVTGEVEKEKSAVGPGGALVVGCKFIRDVEKFNEWGCENDYAVMDFERKLEYLRAHPDALYSNSANKKRKKQTAADATAEAEPTSKKARRASTESVSSVGLVSEKKSNINPTNRQISERRTIKGTDFIGARRIQTGLKGARGEGIRRTVYDGALRVDEDAYKIVRDALADFAGGEAPLLNGRPDWRKLLPMNALIRPTVDTGLGKCVTVTELTESSEAQGGTAATNRNVRVLTVLGAHPPEGDDALRIRGGGEEERGESQSADAMDVDVTSENVAETNEAAIGGETAESLTADEATSEAVAVTENPEPGPEEAKQSDEICNPTPTENSQMGTTADKSNEPTDTKVDEGQITENEVAVDVAQTPAEGQPDTEKVQITGPTGGLNPEQVKLPQSAPSDAIASDETKDSTVIDLATNEENDPAKAPSEAPSSSDAVIADATSKPETLAETEKSSMMCDVKPLESTHQLSASLHNPAVTSTEAPQQIPAFRPSWYDQSKASDFEQRSLPEWFNQSASHRTPTSYIDIREQILDLAKNNPNQYITATALRRSITCDSGSIMRMHSFLTDWGFINGAQIGESAPSEIKMRNMRATWAESGNNAKRKFADVEKSAIWSPDRILSLPRFVLACISKRAGSDGRTTVDVNWEKVAAKVGGGVTVKECQYMFVQPEKGPAAIPPSESSTSHGQETFYSGIIDSVRPEVLKQVIDAALNATDDVAEAKKASLMGAIASVAVEKGKEEEEQIRATLMDIVDQRVQRLENRVSMLDDVEALLEAERVSLELERRDMYTTRCRQWFGDGSS